MSEVEDSDGVFLPPIVFPERRADLLRRILSGTCGRFRIQLTLRDRLICKVVLLTEEVFAVKNSFIYHGGVIPPQWRIVLTFLRKNKITKNDSIQFKSLPNGFPRYHYLWLNPIYDPSLSDGHYVSYDGVGTAISFEESASKAIGELLERYFLTLHKKSSFIFATADEMSKKRKGLVFPTRRFNGFLPFQTEAFSFLKSTDETRFMWVDGEELLSGSRAYIPAQKIFWNFDCNKNPMEPYLGNSTTSGSAGHFTRDEALLSSLHENIERDSFLLYWLNSLPPPEILLPDIVGEPVLDEMLASARQYGLDVHFLDVTSNIAVPSVVCAIVDNHNAEPMMYIAASAGFKPAKILLASLLEAFVLYLYVNNKKKYPLPESYKPFLTKGISRTERLQLWQGKEMYEKFSFFLSGRKEPWNTFLKQERHFEDTKSELSHTLSLFRKLGEGYEVYAYEVKHPVLDSLGYHVVKTVVPKLFPLYLNENMATLDSERLREAPAFLGFPESVAKLNPWPHPFP